MEMLMENKNSNFAYLQFKLGQEACWENYFFNEDLSHYAI